MPQINDTEYEPVEAQAANKAICPYCHGWHSRSDGTPLVGNCNGRYTRSRQTAICVRGLPVGLGTGARVPSTDEVTTALLHAINN
jgi:hypothetical protein